MWVPMSWLGELVELPEGVSVEELAERLTMAGLEVDSIERSGPDLSAIVVGHVLSRKKHPDADRLSVCEVDLGGEAPQTIVCGAPNVDAGQKVAVAKPGIRLQGKKLKKSKIRGVTSNGMICSTSELALTDPDEEMEGILVLDAEAPIGATLDTVLPSGETVLEVAITANRGDCASLLGIAREVSAALGTPVRIPECAAPEDGPPTSDSIAVEIQAPEACHSYAARIVRGVTVGDSPAWLQAKLEAAQLRPINVVVDVTNLVLLELGQPLHAFDLAQVAGERIVVRRAVAGEPLATLDGQDHELSAADLVIADAERAIGLAGVMGGANSEVGDSTRDVLIESAHFSPECVRHTGRRLGIHSDAAYRFARGVDRDGIVRAADRAARLIAELAGGQVDSGIALATGNAPDVVESIEVSPARVNRLLGTDLAATEIVSLLAPLGIVASGSDPLVCEIPSHRNDLRIPADVIEEVARMSGYNSIEPQPLFGELTTGTRPPALELADQVRDAWAAEGFIEVQTFPFFDPNGLDALGLAADDPRRATLRVINPISETQGHLRSTHLPSLLSVVRENRSRQVDCVRIFEVSRVFRLEKEGELPEERWRATALITRPEEARLWEGAPTAELFYEARGAVERLIRALARPLRFAPSRALEPYLHPGACADILGGKSALGVVGEIHPAALSRFEIGGLCALIEIDLSAVGELPTRVQSYREVSRHPQVRRDLAVLLDRDQPSQAVLGAVEKKAGESLAWAEIFDRYEGEGVPEGKVSVAFRLVFQRKDRTLTDEEVSTATEAVVQMLQERFGAEQR